MICKAHIKSEKIKKLTMKTFKVSVMVNQKQGVKYLTANPISVNEKKTC